MGERIGGMVREAARLGDGLTGNGGHGVALEPARMYVGRGHRLHVPGGVGRTVEGWSACVMIDGSPVDGLPTGEAETVEGALEHLLAELRRVATERADRLRALVEPAVVAAPAKPAATLTFPPGVRGMEARRAEGFEVET